MPDKLLNLSNDIVFQELFGNPKNSKITAHLLSLILQRKINNIDLDVNKRMLGNSPNSKIGRLDIRAKFNNGEDCNIELQVAPYQFMPERMLDYWANMHSLKISKGQDYDVLKPSISILIAGYNLNQLKHISKYHTIWNLREKDFSETIITNNIEMHVLEIPKIQTDVINDELAQWLKFIENPENKEVQKIMCRNFYWKQAEEELAYLSGDPDFQRIVEARAGFLMDQATYKKQCEREGHKKGFTKGRAEGRAEGEKSKQIEIAKKLKNKKMPIDDIVEITGLSKDEIKSL